MGSEDVAHATSGLLEILRRVSEVASINPAGRLVILLQSIMSV